MKKTLKKILHRQTTSPCKYKGTLGFCTSGSGFTILELVAVLLILGVITAVAISKFAETNATDIAAANTFKSHLRYAHLRAMGDTETWGIAINSSTSYTLQRNGTTAPVHLPGENSATKTLEKASITPAGTVTFSSGRGLPIDDESGDRVNDRTFTLGSETVTITEFTGFIP